MARSKTFVPVLSQFYYLFATVILVNYTAANDSDKWQIYE